MTRKALVTGATGLLGRQVVLEFERAGWEVVETGFTRSTSTIRKLDIVDSSAVAALLDEEKYESKSTGAANRSPDKCDADPEGARALNVEATRTLAHATSSRSILLIYISTDYVFPGKPGEAPYESDAATHPPNLYGQTKLDGEKAILEQTKETNLGVVLRVPVLYGSTTDHSESAVNILLNKVGQSQEKEAKISMDDWAQRYPTNTEDVGRVCQDIATKYLGVGNKERAELPRILQFSSEDRYTKFEICQLLAEILNLPLEGMVGVKEAGTGVQRPYDTHLSTRALKELGIPVWTQEFKGWWILKDLLASTLRDLSDLESCSVTHTLNILSQASFFNAYTGKKFLSIGGRKAGEEGYFCRVNRAQFRAWLSEHIPVQWNKTFSHYEESESGVIVHFRDGTSAAGDLLVGADGINSPVRSQLLAANLPELNELPLAYIIGEIQLNKAQYERQLALASSFYLVYGEGFKLFAGSSGVSEDKGTASYYWHLSWRDEAAVDNESYWTTHASKKELLDCAKKRVQTMHPNFQELIELTPEDGILQNAVRVRDWIPTDLPQGRVTLLGDAIHPMTQFRGEGANHAMLDGLKLADLINRELAVFSVQGVKDLDVPKVLQMYEEEMLERGRAAVLTSRAAALD
ncbi:hypothetical protein MMC17_005954 [Xylographa soralifera]|nr:hypothetical protein [Xylographa soralifera]